MGLFNKQLAEEKDKNAKEVARIFLSYLREEQYLEGLYRHAKKLDEIMKEKDLDNYEVSQFWKMMTELCGREANKQAEEVEKDKYRISNFACIWDIFACERNRKIGSLKHKDIGQFLF